MRIKKRRDKTEEQYTKEKRGQKYRIQIGKKEGRSGRGIERRIMIENGKKRKGKDNGKETEMTASRSDKERTVTKIGQTSRGEEREVGKNKREE